MEDNPRLAWAPSIARIHSPLWSGFVPALIALGGLALLDTREDLIIVGFYAVVPLVTSIGGRVRVTAAVAAITLVVAGVSGIWNHNDTADFWIRYGLVVGASLFACYVAVLVGRGNRTTRRVELLNAISACGGDRQTLAPTLERLTDLVVPDLADICLIDTFSGDRLERIAVRAAEPRRSEVEPALLVREPSVAPEVAFGDDDPVLNEHVTDKDLRALSRSDEDLAFLRDLGVRSYISVALRSRGRRIGALTLVLAWSGRRFDEDDVHFAEVVADRFALMLDNSGLFSDLESVEMRMDAVMAVLDEPVTITERTGRLIFANQAAIDLAERGSLQALIDLEPGAADFDVYDEAGGLLGRGVLPWQVLDADRGDVVRMVHAARGEEIWLRVRSRPMAALDDSPIYTVSAFEDISEAKFSDFAQSVFASTGELLSASTDRELMLQRLAGLLIPRLADACGVLVPAADGSLALAAFADVDPAGEADLRELISANPLDPEGGGMPEMLRSQDPIVYDTAVLEDWPGAAVELAAGLGARGIGAVMAQPLRVGDRLIGIIGFANHAGRRSFTPLEQRVALRISERVALAIDNARIAGERSEIAATLQSGLRPAVIPGIPGWSLATLYNPAGTENRAGGDFYDMVPIDGGWMAVVGDVTGHGAQAASLTALARHTLRTAATLTGDPVRALAVLNDALLERAGDSLCSVALLRLDQPARGTVRVALAGHPPPLVLHRGASIEVCPDGPVLGAFEDADWATEELALDPGDQILVYTDGVIEARGPDGRFGAERLRRCIAGVEDPERAIGSIRRELEGFAAGDLEDDAVAVAMQLVAAPERAESSAASEGSGRGSAVSPS